MDDKFIFYQGNSEDVLTKEFLTLCKGFVDNKLSIHFWEDKTKCILFSETKRSSKLNIT